MNNYEFSQQLEKRLLEFSKKVALFCKKLQTDRSLKVYIDQLQRSSSSIGANYIEANESLGKKDFYHKLRICRKESKESIYWLDLISSQTPLSTVEAKLLKSECDQFMRIFSKVVNKLTY